MRPASICFCLFLSIALLPAHSVGDDDVNADYYFTRGQYYAEQENFSEAAKWYRKAADLGHSGAQIMLGNLYFRGLGVQKDVFEAIKWARLAADQGNATAQASLGYAYHTGQGVPQNISEAEQWYLMAANQKHFNGMVMLARFYDSQRQFAEAIAWSLVAMTLSKDDYEYRAARDVMRNIFGVRGGKATGEDNAQGEILANSILQRLN